MKQIRLNSYDEEKKFEDSQILFEKANSYIPEASGPLRRIICAELDFFRYKLAKDSENLPFSKLMIMFEDAKAWKNLYLKLIISREILRVLLREAREMGNRFEKIDLLATVAETFSSVVTGMKYFLSSSVKIEGRGV